MSSSTIPSQPILSSPPSNAPETSSTSHPNHESTTNADSDSDLDALLASDAEDDPTLLALQSSRLAELKASAAASHSISSSPFAAVQTYTSEKPLMHAVAAHPRSVLLFTHPDFAVCGQMAAHLERIAGLVAYEAGAHDYSFASSAEGGAKEVKEGDIRDKETQENVLFLRIDATDAPFLTDRLRVRVLPCVVGYVRGVECGKLVGFEGLGRRGRNSAHGWKRVAAVLRSWGIIEKGRLRGEEEDGDEDEEGEEQDEDDGMVQRQGSSWIGSGGKAGNKNKTRTTRVDSDDDWD